MAEVRREWLEKDYYKDLELTKVATDEEISSAYKKLVRKLHPDRNPGNQRAEERFKEVSNAYEVIGNPETRKQYDQVRQAGIFGAGGSPMGGSGNAHHQHFEFDGDDLLSSLFGKGGGFSAGGQVRLRGTDYETNARITFDESIKGVEKNVQGYGGKTIKIKLPQGVSDESRVKLTGKGAPGTGGGPSGDLFVAVSVEKHELFERKGNNLILKFPISFSEAALGATIEVPTYESDKVNIRIPSGTSSGTKFKIKGQGVATPKNKRGDLLVQVEIQVPQKLNSQQKKAIKGIEELLGNPPR